MESITRRDGSTEWPIARIRLSDSAPASYIYEAGAGLCILSGVRGVAQTAPEETDYCVSVSVSTSVTAVASVGVSASVSSESLRFLVSTGAVGLPEVLGVVVR